ncbi:MAG: hypothetical protein PHG02_07995 [Oscillospiraceae bacterium]|nr:hypothetical protein [Oscillospiraceae bacterium]
MGVIIITKKVLAAATFAVAALWLLAGLLFLYYGTSFWQTWVIALGTTFYHFAMRWLVGAAYQGLLHNCVDYTHRWFAPRHFEPKLYAAVHIKRWKSRLPVYNKAWFHIAQGCYEQVVMAMCQAELVHETIMALAFVPVLFAAYFQAFWVFLLTSVASALIDLPFVMLQRYNRPRLLRLMAKKAACKTDGISL